MTSSAKAAHISGGVWLERKSALHQEGWIRTQAWHLHGPVSPGLGCPTCGSEISLEFWGTVSERSWLGDG